MSTKNDDKEKEMIQCSADHRIQYHRIECEIFKNILRNKCHSPSGEQTGSDDHPKRESRMQINQIERRGKKKKDDFPGMPPGMPPGMQGMGTDFNQPDQGQFGQGPDPYAQQDFYAQQGQQQQGQDPYSQQPNPYPDQNPQGGSFDRLETGSSRILAPSDKQPHRTRRSQGLSLQWRRGGGDKDLQGQEAAVPTSSTKKRYLHPRCQDDQEDVVLQRERQARW